MGESSHWPVENFQITSWFLETVVRLTDLQDITQRNVETGVK